MKRPLIPVLVTIVLALAAGGAVFLLLMSADSRAMAEREVATVLLAEQDVPEGTGVAYAKESGLLSEATVPTDLMPADALDPSDPATAGLVFVSSLPAGQMVLRAAVGTELPSTAAIDVPPGQMALSVLLDDPAKVGAFLRPGSRVAVFDTFAVPGSADAGEPLFETRVLLDDVEVIAVGSATRTDDAAADEEGDWTAQLVTLAVTQDQAERLVHATRTGALHFALLGEDTDLTASEGVSDVTLFP